MTKKVMIGSVAVGGGEKVKIQSMTTCKTSDIEKCAAQTNVLAAAGCEIIRYAVLDEADAYAIKTLKTKVSIPIVADIHFSPRLAVLAVENGADKLRINPGNIGGEKEIALVADCIKAHHIPVRVGANTGSIEKQFFARYGRSAQALAESALYNAAILEKHGVSDIVLSVKASDVPLTVEAYSMLPSLCDYPLHVGVTEAGSKADGVIKSAVGIGSLLLRGIGDTIRVSLTDDSIEEVYAAKRILRACGLDKDYIEVVSCPTCGRCRWNSMALAEKVKEFVAPYKKRGKVAVMGCVVNGPGEAKDADLGIAGGDGVGIAEAEGDDIVRLLRAGQAAGDDRGVAAVGAAGRGGRRVADELRAAGRAGIALHPVFGPVAALGRGPGALVAVRRCGGFIRRGGLGRGLRVFALIEGFDLVDGVARSAIVALQPSGRAHEMQGAGTGGELIVGDLICHRRENLLIRACPRRARAGTQISVRITQ